MPEGPVLVRALFDYVRVHTDELTFRKGDIITVTQQVEGGWWEGSLNGMLGWFPSNYVAALPDDVMRTGAQPSPAGLDRQALTHLHNFQDEIVQHILEGEIRQVNELAQLVSSIITHLEPLSHLPFLNKISHMKELLTQAISMHQAIASALMEMKQRPNEPKRVGKLFLEFAPTVNAIGCDYSKIHLYVVTGLDKNVDLIDRHLTSRGVKFQLARCKQQLCLVFDRLGRYPLLLKEIERYLEHPHVDREDILQAMNIYGEITERCAILRKFKEYDIDILLSTINSWQGVSIDKLGDPILTLRVVVTDVEQDPSDPSPIVLHTNPDGTGGQLSVVMIFPTCVLLLARTQQSNVYEFTMKLALNTLSVVGCYDSDTDLDLIVSAFSSDRESVRPCRISLSCTDQNARDLLLSTLTDLIHYQTDLAPSVSTQSSTHALNESVTASLKPDALAGGDQQQFTAPVSSTTTKQSYDTSSVLPPPTVSSESQLSSGAQPRGSPSTTSSDTNPTARETTPPSLCVKPAVTTSSSLVPRSSPSFSSGMHFLPHQITHHAHVQWLTSLDEDQNENEQPLPPRVLHSLHLDGPLDMNQHSSSHRVFSYINLGGSPVGPFPTPTDEAATKSRPYSPKGDGVKELRRKKSDRQKSAINVDEVLRSVDKLHDVERRTADAALILQVVEAYCASAWTELSCRSVEAGQATNKDVNNPLGSTMVSPTESKTLLQQFSSPTLTLQTGPESIKHSTVLSPSEVGRPNQDFARLAKRSGSKNKADLLQTPCLMDQGLLQSSYTNTPADSVVHSMSPPPVILPTRSGRRL